MSYGRRSKVTRIRRSSTSKSTNNQGANQLLRPTDLVSPAQPAIRPTAKLNAANDLRRLSGSNLTALKGIQFGSPSSAGTKPSSTGAGNEWSSLIKTASGGAASLVGGGFLESGISSLISGLASLFGGGGKSEAPPVRFTLPDSQQQTVYVRSPQGTALQGPVYKQADIAQAVKNALLTSSSLNDVIAEI